VKKQTWYNIALGLIAIIFIIITLRLQEQGQDLSEIRLQQVRIIRINDSLRVQIKNRDCIDSLKFAQKYKNLRNHK
jgi:hypothetical protein